MQRFDIAFGHCRIRDDTLVIERTDPDEMSRWETYRAGLSTNIERRPRAVAVYLGVMLLLGLVFVYLLVDIYLSNPGAAPLVVGLGIVGVLVVGGSLEVSFRRAMRKRRELRSALADEFNVARPGRIPLDTISGVTVRSESMIVPLVSGKQFLVHFERDGTEATTQLGFPEFMTDEMATARRVFEHHNIPIKDDVQR